MLTRSVRYAPPPRRFEILRGGSAGPENRTEVFELLARTLTRMGGGQPLVLVLEDLHAAEASIERCSTSSAGLGRRRR